MLGLRAESTLGPLPRDAVVGVKPRRAGFRQAWLRLGGYGGAVAVVTVFRVWGLRVWGLRV